MSPDFTLKSQLRREQPGLTSICTALLESAQRALPQQTCPNEPMCVSRPTRGVSHWPWSFTLKSILRDGNSNISACKNYNLQKIL
jgi:hypothetical protein